MMTEFKKDNIELTLEHRVSLVCSDGRRWSKTLNASHYRQSCTYVYSLSFDTCGAHWEDTYECEQPEKGYLAMNHLCFAHLEEMHGPLGDYEPGDQVDG